MINIYTVITKKSVRETLKNKKFLKFYSTNNNLKIGEMLEIIVGKRKTIAIILKKESITDLKQKIRSGCKIEKLIFSKTGKKANGKIIDKFELNKIKTLLKNPLLIKKETNKNLKKFFPKKRETSLNSSINKKNKTKKTVSEIKDLLSIERFKNNKPKYHNEMQEIVDTIRNYFNEKQRYGIGSFSYYIGFFKKIPLNIVWQYFSEVKQLKNKTNEEKKRIFWWKIGNYLKTKKKNNC